MTNPDPRHRLLTDLFAEDPAPQERQQLLAESLRHVRRRRHARALVRGLALAAGLVVAATLGYQHLIHPAPVLRHPSLAPADSTQPDFRVSTAQVHLGHFQVTTPEILQSGRVAYAEIRTAQVPTIMQLLSDRELVALFSDQGAMLMRQKGTLELWLLRDGRLQAVH